MRITLLHNPGAGRKHTSKESLLAALQSAGHEVVYQSAEEDVAQALHDPGDLVAVAGGDGTVAQAAQHLLERDIPLGLLPLGTANNIARTLGVAGPLPSIIARWPSAQRTPFDVGRAQGPWGETLFFEAAGLGLFPRTMRAVERKAGRRSSLDAREQLHRDLKQLRKTLEHAPARPVELYVDGQDYSGAYFLLEVMNMPLLGPNLPLAPQADPGDGALDLVLLPETERAAFATYLDDRLKGRTGLLDLPACRGKHVQIRWEGAPFHADDNTYGTDGTSSGQIDLRVIPQAQTFLT